MDNNIDLPEGWAMPDYMAKRISESINKKRITPEDKIQTALDEMARDIVLIEPNPQDWGWWVSYLLEQFEEKAKRRGKQRELDEMIKLLREDLDQRELD